MSALAGNFAAMGLALYAAHHVGDYWVQTDHDAAYKGKEGLEGRIACTRHVVTYLITQCALAAVTAILLGIHVSWTGALAGLGVSGLTHYLADRREYGIMFAIARTIPGKANFLKLGVPRPPVRHHLHSMALHCPDGSILPAVIEVSDNPSLGTGAWALDQSWHIFWGVFVAGLLMVIL